MASASITADRPVRRLTLSRQEVVRGTALVRLVASTCTASMCLSALAPVQAQTQTPVLEEIIVTARKRAENLQNVPISASVMFGARLTTSAISTLEELHAHVPNLFMTETAISSNLFIRGIGSGVNQGFEQSVGLYVDGIYHGRAQLTRAPFFDLERVEILRGPQSTLLGKNSVAGALSLVTRRPTDAWEADLTARYAPEFGDAEINGVVSGPLHPRLRGRVALRGRQSDGYMHNVTAGRDEPSRDERALRISLDWDLATHGRLYLKAETASFDVTGRQIEIVEDRPAATGPFTGLTYGQILTGIFQQPAAVLDSRLDYRRNSNGDSSRNDTEGVVLALDWDLGGLTLTSITGHMAYDYQELCDCDFTAANLFRSVFSEDFDQKSQELRFTSPTGKVVQYVTGVYWERGKLEFFDALQIDENSALLALVDANPSIPMPPFPPQPGTVLLGNTASPREFTQQSDVAALFAHATWHAADLWRVSFGGRFTREKKEATRTLTLTNLDTTPLDPQMAPLTVALYNTLFNATPHALAGHRRKDKFMPSLAIEWDATGNVLAYVAATKGFKSGGFDVRSNNPPENPLFPASVGSFMFDDEEALNLEIGTKMVIGGGRAELHAALYSTRYADLQVSMYDGTLGFNVGNAGSATARGLELETRYLITGNLTLSGALALTDFQYRRFFGQCHFGRQPDAPDGINCDYRGKTNQYTPDWSGILSTDWHRPVGRRLQFRWMADLSFTDSYLLSPTLHPDAVQRRHGKFDSRVSVGSREGSWEVAVLGRNLTDEATSRHGNETPLAGSIFGAPGFFYFIDPPRSVALQATFRFR
jgi:iron complex outermembrane recepter protein